MGWVSRQWGGLESVWIARSRGWWSVAQSLLGGQWLVVHPRDQYWVWSCLTSSLMIWMMGQSVPSVKKRTFKLRGVVDTPEGHAVIQGTLAGWRTGLTGILWRSTRRSAKSYTREGRTSCTHIRWGTHSWKAALQKRTKGSWGTRSWPWGNNMPLGQRNLMVSWAALGKALPAGQGRWYFPSTHHWWGHTWITVSSSGFLHARETWTYWRESNQGPHRWWRDRSISPMRVLAGIAKTV